MTDSILVLHKLSTLREHIDRARRRRPRSPEALRADVDLQDALAMSLLVAIQEAVDIAFHIEGGGIPSSYADGFGLLARHGALDAALADTLARTVGVRHRIAHGYATVDIERIWSELPAGLDALDAFAGAIARFLSPTAG